MKMRMTEREFGEIFYEDSFPDDFKSVGAITERTSHLSHRLGDMRVSEIWFEGILINYGEASFQNALYLDVETDAAGIEMHFSLSGNTAMKFSGVNTLPEGFGSAEHNIIYTPGFSGSLDLTPVTKAHSFFEIHLTENFFKKLVQEEDTILHSLVRGMEKKEIAVLSKENLGITSKMNSVILEIMACKRKGALQRIYLESKVLELLMLQTEQFEEASTKSKSFQLRPADIEKLHYTKWLIEQNLHEPHTLLELSKKAGLNEYKLKKGFKEIWGTTVFGYLHNLRMEEAKVLILEHGKTVGEAADYAGYKNAHHFTAAFKKHFGYLPKELKNN